jgi:hypothetical protein
LKQEQLSAVEWVGVSISFWIDSRQLTNFFGISF